MLRGAGTNVLAPLLDPVENSGYYTNATDDVRIET